MIQVPESAWTCSACTVKKHLRHILWLGWPNESLGGAGLPCSDRWLCQGKKDILSRTSLGQPSLHYLFCVTGPRPSHIGGQGLLGFGLSDQLGPAGGRYSGLETKARTGGGTEYSRTGTKSRYQHAAHCCTLRVHRSCQGRGRRWYRFAVHAANSAGAVMAEPFARAPSSNDGITLSLTLRQLFNQRYATGDPQRAAHANPKTIQRTQAFVASGSARGMRWARGWRRPRGSWRPRRRGPPVPSLQASVLTCGS